MKISKTGIDLIKKWEGCRLQVYEDLGGVKTIGWGHAYWNGAPSITQEVADQLLLQDIEKFEKKVNEYDSIYHWNQNEFDALISFAYNIGGIKQLTNAGKRSRETIAKKIPEYCNMAGRRVQGLVDRRNEEKDLFLKPCKTQDSSTNKTNTQLADEVIKGLWGNGEERKQRLTNAGYDYMVIQNIVNMRMNLKKTDEIVNEVIRGTWGNGEDRKRRLTEAGYNYSKIQALVNERLKK